MDASKFPFCTEFYLVDKAVEVVVSIGGNPVHLRIEALRNEVTNEYLTRSYCMSHLTVQPTYPKYGEKLPPLVDVRVWIDYDLPWTSGNSADDVIGQALRFLRERCDQIA